MSVDSAEGHVVTVLFLFSFLFQSYFPPYLLLRIVNTEGNSVK